MKKNEKEWFKLIERFVVAIESIAKDMEISNL